MEDKVPDMLEFDDSGFNSVHILENSLKLDDPPKFEKSLDKSEDCVPEMLNFDDSDLNSLHILENSLKLADPPQLGVYSSNENENEKSDKIVQNIEFSEDLLNLSEPPKYEERIETDKLGEDFDSLIKDLKYTIKNDEEINESFYKNSDDKKSDKSYIEDGFEYVKKEELEKDEGEEIRRELENMVCEEEMKLKSFVPCNILERDINNGNKTEYSLDYNTLDFDKELISLNDSIVLCHATGEHSTKDEKHNINIPQYSKTADTYYHEPYITDKSEGNETLSNESNNAVVNKCMDIVKWCNPVSSAIIFTIIMTIQYGLLMEYLTIPILGYSGLFLIIISSIYKLADTFKLIDNQSCRKYLITFNKEDIGYFVNLTMCYIVYLHKEIKSIAYVESYKKNIKVFAILYVLTYVGNIFNLKSVMFIGSLLVFSIPVVYTKYGMVIHQVVDTIQGHMEKLRCSTQRIR